MQTNLSGSVMQVEEPDIEDKFRKCQKENEVDEKKRVRLCGNSPYLTLVYGNGVRTPYCKMHAREEWIDAYETE